MKKNEIVFYVLIIGIIALVNLAVSDFLLETEYMTLNIEIMDLEDVFLQNQKIIYYDHCQKKQGKILIDWHDIPFNAIGKNVTLRVNREKLFGYKSIWHFSSLKIMRNSSRSTT